MTKKGSFLYAPNTSFIILPFFLLKRDIYYGYKEKKK